MDLHIVRSFISLQELLLLILCPATERRPGPFADATRGLSFPNPLDPDEQTNHKKVRSKQARCQVLVPPSCVVSWFDGEG